MAEGQPSGEGSHVDIHTISVVIPVYQGEQTLPEVVSELSALLEPRLTDGGHRYAVTEVILAYDNGPDGSAAVVRGLAAADPRIRPVWLSRNFGQHAATLAGMASSGGDWIITMDEDGQHDPAAIPRLLDVAMRERAGVVYADPVNAAPHGMARNLASRGGKWLVHRIANDKSISSFQSYRLVLGELGRSVAAYAGAGVYLDVALSWVNGRVAQCPVRLREASGRPSGYSLRTLLSHFWRLVLTSGTRALRAVALLGVVFGVLGVLVAAYAIGGSLIAGVDQPGWTSTVVLISIGTGAILFSLGIVAEYLGVVVSMAMGRPLYLIVQDPRSGPLSRPPAATGGPGEQ